MHLANFSGRQGGCTLKIRRTNKVGNGERKSIWQRLEGSRTHCEATVDVQKMEKSEDGLQALSNDYNCD